MSAIDDLISGIDGVTDRLTEATTATSALIQETEQAIEQAESLGGTSLAQGLSQAKEKLEALISHEGDE